MATNKEIYFSPVSQDAYEGASEHYRLEQRGLLQGEQDTLAGRELRNLWARSHHAVRNNSWASTAKREYRTNLGAINVAWKMKDGKEHTRMQDLWDEFKADPNLDGYGNLDNLQDVWNASMFESGEVLTRMLIKRRKGFKIPLVLQTIESEFLDPRYNDPEKSIKNGIQFKDSRPSVYHFSKALSSIGVAGEKTPVKAEDMIHMFIRERPGQWRGIPQLAPILLPLYELDDLTDSTINKQKAAQAVSWIIKNTNPSAAIALGTTRSTTDAADTDSAGNKRRISQSGSGNVQYLNKGEELYPVQGTDIGSSLIDLIKTGLHSIAKGAGLTYEVLAGDLSGISFSALKFVINSMKTRAEFIYKFYTINLGLVPLCNRFQELTAIYSTKSTSSAIYSFEYPRRAGIDDLKDTQADLLEITSGMSTLRRKQKERNVTMEEVIKDNEERKAAGIDLKPAPQSTNVKPNPNSTSV